MIGYYNNAEATSEAIDADGWLHTGDLAVRLPNGYYKITGRIKDMVIRGGENIYPREIEEFLFTHPAVEQASVVGVPDPKYGEELCALDQAEAGMAGNCRRSQWRHAVNRRDQRRLTARSPTKRSATFAARLLRTTRCLATSASSMPSRRR